MSVPDAQPCIDAVLAAAALTALSAPDDDAILPPASDDGQTQIHVCAHDCSCTTPPQPCAHVICASGDVCLVCVRMCADAQHAVNDRRMAVCSVCDKRCDGRHAHRVHNDGRIHVTCHRLLTRPRVRAADDSAIVTDVPLPTKRRRKSDLGECTPHRHASARRRRVTTMHRTCTLTNCNLWRLHTIDTFC